MVFEQIKMPFAGSWGKDSRLHLCLELHDSGATNAESCIHSKTVRKGPKSYSRRGSRLLPDGQLLVSKNPKRKDLD